MRGASSAGAPPPSQSRRPGCRRRSRRRVSAGSTRRRLRGFSSRVEGREPDVGVLQDSRARGRSRAGRGRARFSGRRVAAVPALSGPDEHEGDVRQRPRRGTHPGEVEPRRDHAHIDGDRSREVEILGRRLRGGGEMFEINPVRKCQACAGHRSSTYSFSACDG